MLLQPKPLIWPIRQQLQTLIDHEIPKWPQTALYIDILFT